MYVYVNTGEAHQNYKLLKTPRLVQNPDMTVDELFSATSLTLDIYNFDFDGKTTLSYTQDVTVFNT